VKTTTANTERVVIERPAAGALEITRLSDAKYGLRVAKRRKQGWSSLREFATDTAFGAWLQSVFARSQPMEYLELPKR
jgi:hypothetical protein